MNKRNTMTLGMLLGILATVLYGCAMPRVYRSKVEFPVPVRGFKHPLTEPAAREREGIVLTYKPQQQPLTYQIQDISFRDIAGNEGNKMIVEQTQVVSISLADDGENLVRKEVLKMKGIGSVHSRVLMRPQGNVMEFLESKGTGIMGLANVKSVDTKETELFPEGRIKVGDVWDQETQMSSKSEVLFMKMDFSNKIQIKWRLSGFATVNGRRCAVLEGISAGELKDTSSGSLPKVDFVDKGRTVKYFDYEQGIDVETIYSSSLAWTGTQYAGQSGSVSQRIATLVE